jgi:hypothetical protein
MKLCDDGLGYIYFVLEIYIICINEDPKTECCNKLISKYSISLDKLKHSS